LLSVFPAHVPADAPFARELTLFLESGCDQVCVASDTVVGLGADLLASAEIGLSADVLLLLLSPASNLARWQRERWERVLFAQAEEADTRVGVVLLGTCSFPELFRRRLRFFEASSDTLSALRGIKRWINGIRSATPPDFTFSGDLEALYKGLADVPGTLTATGAEATRFAREAARDFEAVCRVPAHGRTLAQIAGELGSQLGMTLDGPIEDNCRRIHELLSRRRCLVIFDAPEVSLRTLKPSGRTSVLLTDERSAPETPMTFAAARRLVNAGRFAEAYEILAKLYEDGVETESCAREMVWICDHWGRYVEASLLRTEYRVPATEQLSLF
jgi:hypothetical protein